MFVIEDVISSHNHLLTRTHAQTYATLRIGNEKAAFMFRKSNPVYKVYRHRDHSAMCSALELRTLMLQAARCSQNRVADYFCNHVTLVERGIQHLHGFQFIFGEILF